MSEPIVISRRAVLAGAGALIVSFSSASRLVAQDSPRRRRSPAAFRRRRSSISWIRIGADGRITVFTGKAELGQGIKTAFLQIAAEQLDTDPGWFNLVTADTAMTPNEGYTAGSHSLQDSGTAIMNAAAQVRQLLIAEAARRSGVPADQLKTDNAVVIAPDGRRFGYGDLVAAEMLHVQAAPELRLKYPANFKIMGERIQRVDIPAKVTGGAAYVQDFRPDGMVHARVVRPPSYGAQLVEVETGGVEKMPGVLKVVRDGSFLAVIAEREFQAIEAMRALAAAARWQETAKLPDMDGLPAMLEALPSQDITVLDQRLLNAGGVQSLSATYTRPYLSHGSIGPSCAVAQLENDAMTVWTHTQGVFPDRDAIAEMLHMPKDKVRCIHSEGSGCYGHNGADDAAADAALLARAMPGRPVRVQWTREQEHAWEPYGPAMVVKVSASLDDRGHIADWDYAVWSNTHSMRPGARRLAAGGALSRRAVSRTAAEADPDAGGRRRPQFHPAL